MYCQLHKSNNIMYYIDKVVCPICLYRTLDYRMYTAGGVVQSEIEQLLMLSEVTLLWYFYNQPCHNI